MKTESMTMQSETVVEGKKAPVLDIRALLRKHEGRNYELHAEHINPANVRTLRRRIASTTVYRLYPDASRAGSGTSPIEW